MNKLLLITVLGFLMLGCAAQEEVKAFHPTDDISSQAQGGKGEVGDGSEVHLDQVNWFKVIKLSFKVKREWDYLMILLR